MFKKLSFSQLLGAVLVLAFVLGFALYLLSGATTNKGTTGAIRAESATIMTAEKTRCIRYGSYASVSTLLKEGLLASKPLYDSVVFLPGKGCGTIVIGSPAYQSAAG
jgi:hypothetical protein